MGILRIAVAGAGPRANDYMAVTRNFGIKC